MSGDNGPSPGVAQRRSSITQAALSNLFSRGPSANNVPPIPSPNDGVGRRLSVNTIGLSGSSPTTPSVFANIRRGSLSTSSGSIDENAIDDDEFTPELGKTPNPPFARRMSVGAAATASMRGYRPGGGSPNNGNANPTSPPPAPSSQLGRRPSVAKSPPAAGSAAWPTPGGRRASIILSSSLPPQASYTLSTRVSSDNSVPRADQQAFNWSEQLRSRAESSVSGARPSFSFGSPPRQAHDRARSVSDMMQPPVQAPVQPKPEPRKPDAFQERILKGDFYMD